MNDKPTDTGGKLPEWECPQCGKRGWTHDPVDETQWSPCDERDCPYSGKPDNGLRPLCDDCGGYGDVDGKECSNPNCEEGYLLDTPRLSTNTDDMEAAFWNWRPKITLPTDSPTEAAYEGWKAACVWKES